MQIRRVILVFKTHFDIGFTKLSREILDDYAGEMLDRVAATCEATRGMGGLAYVWTMPAWPLAEVRRRVSGERAAMLDALIARGQVAWHALPYTSHYDFAGAADAVWGLRYARELSERYGAPLRRAAKMTDVPGHGRFLPELLASAGIHSEIARMQRVCQAAGGAADLLVGSAFGQARADDVQLWLRHAAVRAGGLALLHVDGADEHAGQFRSADGGDRRRPARASGGALSRRGDRLRHARRRLGRALPRGPFWAARRPSGLGGHVDSRRRQLSARSGAGAEAARASGARRAGAGKRRAFRRCRAGVCGHRARMGCTGAVRRAHVGARRQDVAGRDSGL